MNEDIQNAIKKNLPGEVGELLKQELQELSELRIKYKQKEDLYNYQATELNNLRSLKLDKSKLDERELSILKRENECKLQEEILKVKLEALSVRNNDIFTLVSFLTKNTFVKKNIFENTSDIGRYNSQTGQTEGTKSELRSVTETIEIE